MKLRILFEVNGEVLHTLAVGESKPEHEGQLSRWHPSAFYPNSMQTAFFNGGVVKGDSELVSYSLQLARRKGVEKRAKRKTQSK